jgi:hypothetical protein
MSNEGAGGKHQQDQNAESSVAVPYVKIEPSRLNFSFSKYLLSVNKRVGGELDELQLLAY